LASLKTALENDQVYLAVFNAVVKGEIDVDSNCGIENELLLYKNRWSMAKDQNVRRTIMEAERDSRITGHHETYKTIGSIGANFFWLRMDEHIIQ